MRDTGEIDIEVMPQLATVVSDRWPISVLQARDELFSSWLHRIAFAHGLSPRHFGYALGLESQNWSAHLSNVAPAHLFKLLNRQTDVTVLRMTAMTIGIENWLPMALPMRWHVTNRNRATWLQFCPHCLCEDQEPYFRRRWRRATFIMCPDHNRGLVDRCPNCRSGILSSDQRTVLPLHFCTECRFDLRGAKGLATNYRTRTSCELIDALVAMESACGIFGTSALASLIQALPSVQRRATEENFISLSTNARLRCLGNLEVNLNKYLATDPEPAIAARRRSMIAAVRPLQSHQPLVRRRASSLTGGSKPSLQKPSDKSAQRVDLSTLISAYHAMTARRSKKTSA